MKNGESRRVQGIYMAQEDLKGAVEELHEKGYVNEEMCLVVKRGHNAYPKLQTYSIDSYEVDTKVTSRGFVEKLKDLVLVEEEKNEESISLQDLGIEKAAVERFTSALEEGSILLLVDSLAPRSPQHYYK